MESHRKGDLTEAVVVAELKRREVAVSVPFGDNERYDAVVETPRGGLLRVQIKTGWITDGVVEFKGYSQHTNASGTTRKRYEGAIDHFLVYVHETDAMYMVPAREVGDCMWLRVAEPDQAQPSINWAEDYAFDRRWPPDADSGGQPRDPGSASDRE